MRRTPGPTETLVVLARCKDREPSGWPERQVHRTRHRDGDALFGLFNSRRVALNPELDVVDPRKSDGAHLDVEVQRAAAELPVRVEVGRVDEAMHLAGLPRPGDHSRTVEVDEAATAIGLLVVEPPVALHREDLGWACDGDADEVEALGSVSECDRREPVADRGNGREGGRSHARSLQQIASIHSSTSQTESRTVNGYTTAPSM